MGLSQRAYARHRGVSEAAVRKALKAGRITSEPDGTIDPMKADRQWQAHTLLKGAAKRLPEASVGSTYMQAKTAHEVLKVQTSKVRLQSLKDALVDREKAAAHVFALMRSMRDSWLNWPARIAGPLSAALKVDEHQLQTSLDFYIRQHLAELGDSAPDFKEI